MQSNEQLEEQMKRERADIHRLDTLIKQQTGLLKVHGKLKEEADLLIKYCAALLMEDEQYIQDVAKAIEGFVKRRKQRDVTRKKLINLLETPP